MLKSGTQRFGIEAVAFSYDGKTLAGGGADNVLHLWEVATGREGPQFGPSQFVPHIARFSYDDGIAASGYFDGIYLWNPSTGKTIRQLGQREGEVTCLAFSNHGGMLVSGGDGKLLHYWNVTTGQHLRELKGHRSSVLGMSVSQDRQTLFSGASDRTISSWNVERGCLLRTATLPDPFSVIAFSPDGNRAAIITNPTSSLKVLQIQGGVTGTQWRRIQADAVAFSPDGKLLATAHEDTSVSFWDSETGKSKGQITLTPGRIRCLVFAHDGRALASGDRDGRICVWDVLTGKPRLQLRGHEGAIWSLDFSWDNHLLASASEDTTVLIWDIMSTELINSALTQEISRSDVASLWTLLSDNDASRAYAAMVKLAAAPSQSVAFLKPRLKPVILIDNTRIQNLVIDLDSPKFSTRDGATQELLKIGDQTGPALKKILEKPASPEVRQRISQILTEYEQESRSGRYLQKARAIETLGHIQCKEAQQILEKLAKGAPEAGITQEARRSLESAKEKTSTQRH